MRLRQFLALFVAGLGLAFAGCGGSDDEVAVQAAPDDSAQVKKLEDRISNLKQQIADKQAAGKDAAVRKAEATATAGEAEAAGTGGDPEVNAAVNRLPGEAGIVIGPPGGGEPDLIGGSITTGDAWSTIKVPIAERVLADAGGPNRITAAQDQQISQAITESDNQAAESLFAGLEQEHGGLEGASIAVQEMLRQAGDDQTVVSTRGRDGFSTYGQTDWSLLEQYRYMAALAGGCISNSVSRSYLLGKMSTVGGSDLFGLGASGFPAKWKGGWGPGTDGKYLVRQMGFMDVDGKPMVVVMAAVADDGTFETSRTMLSRLARWTGAHFSGRISTPTGC